MAFKRLDPEDFVVSSDSVTSTVWSNNSPVLNTYQSSSVQKEGASGPFYISIYQTSSISNTAEVQFQIAYGNKNGGGGIDYDGAVPNVSSTSTIYSCKGCISLSIKNLLLNKISASKTSILSFIRYSFIIGTFEGILTNAFIALISFPL